MQQRGVALVYLDETGFESSTERLYGWGRPGQRVYGYRQGGQRQRTSLIGGYLNHRLIAPLLFEGTCNTLLLNAWLTDHLLPALPAGSTLVLDNAAFHKAASTQAIVAQAGHQLLFLPPYSPHLNPIEKLWANLKHRWRQLSLLSLEQLVQSSGYL